MKHTALTTESFAAIFGWARFTGAGFFGVGKIATARDGTDGGLPPGLAEAYAELHPEKVGTRSLISSVGAFFAARS